MAISVEIIKEGYSALNHDSKFMKANSSCTLIRGPKVNVIVDTLTAWDSEYLRNELQKRCLNCDDITHVVCTHGHSDHVGNLNLFLKATHIIGQSVNYQDLYTLHPFHEGVPYIITESIEVISTPGHTLSDVSVVVKNTSLGIVVVAGDLFEKQEDINDSSLWKETAGSEDPKLQYKNRQRILRLANYIIPGHGPMFEVTEQLVKLHDQQQ